MLFSSLEKILDWKSISGGYLAVGENKTLTVNEKINEVMVMGDFVNSIIFSRAEQEIKPNQLMIKNLLMLIMISP